MGPQPGLRRSQPRLSAASRDTSSGFCGVATKVLERSLIEDRASRRTMARIHHVADRFRLRQGSAQLSGGGISVGQKLLGAPNIVLERGNEFFLRGEGRLAANPVFEMHGDFEVIKILIEIE